MTTLFMKTMKMNNDKDTEDPESYKPYGFNPVYFFENSLMLAQPNNEKMSNFAKPSIQQQ